MYVQVERARVMAAEAASDYDSSVGKLAEEGRKVAEDVAVLQKRVALYARHFDLVRGQGQVQLRRSALMILHPTHPPYPLSHQLEAEEARVRTEAEEAADLRLRTVVVEAMVRRRIEYMEVASREAMVRDSR